MERGGKRRGGANLTPPHIRNPRRGVVVSSSLNVETASILANRPGWYGVFAPSGQRCVDLPRGGLVRAARVSEDGKRSGWDRARSAFGYAHKEGVIHDE